MVVINGSECLVLADIVYMLGALLASAVLSLMMMSASGTLRWKNGPVDTVKWGFFMPLFLLPGELLLIPAHGRCSGQIKFIIHSHLKETGSKFQVRYSILVSPRTTLLVLTISNMKSTGLTSRNERAIT